jgi:predicted protein tyrosine phosphatase
MPADPLMNRLGNARNQFQGSYRRVLCVCSAGLLRAPTAAWVLSQEPYNYNTRAAGVTEEFALIPVDKVLLHWADEIVCLNEEHARVLRKPLKELGGNKPVIVLGIPDHFEYRDPELVELIKSAYDAAKPPHLPTSDDEM